MSPCSWLVAIAWGSISSITDFQKDFCSSLRNRFLLALQPSMLIRMPSSPL